jgi:hypothetical protein
MRGKPKNMMKTKGQMPQRSKNVPRETVSDPRVSYVYRKDAFKKVKIA